MNAIVRSFLTEIQRMNDDHRLPLPLQADPSPSNRLQRQALDYIVHQRLARPLVDGFKITRDGRAWLRQES